MSFSVECPACKAVVVQIDDISFELRFNLLKAENQRFRKALEKYADPERHSMDPDGNLWYGDYFDYETARAALEKK
jgi:hypothetical protein